MVTLRPGVTLITADRLLIDDAAKAVGLDPSMVVVTKGSNVPPDSLSGSTHAGPNGVWDQRVWNIPSGKIEPLIVELRKRNVCAWLRDQEHGGFDPHIHCVRRDATGLSYAARQQVASYDRERNGLTGKSEGPDYHPRPTQRRWPWPATPPRVVVTWDKLKAGDKQANELVGQALNRLPGTRFSVSKPFTFANVKGPLAKYRLATLSVTYRAALQRLAKQYGTWFTP